MRDDLRSWVSEHKLATVLLGFGLLFLAALMLSFVAVILGGGQLGGNMQMADSSARTTSADAGGHDLSLDRFHTKSTTSRPRDDGGGAGAFVEVQEARFDIDTDDASGDADHVRSLAEAHGGYVEESRKRESSLYRTIDLTVRVPDEDFDAFTDTVRSQFDVDSFNVKNYRLSTEREIDELTLLNRTLADYEEMREQIREMNNSEAKINLLMELTEKELQVKEKQQRYQNQLSDKQKRGDEATIRIELRERKSVDVWPENLKNRFMNNVKNMLNNLTNIVLGTATQAVVLFFQAVQVIIYLAVIALPVIAAYRVIRRLYQNHWK